MPFLGVYHYTVSRTTGEIKQKFKWLVPFEHRNPGMLYKAYQVETLRNWAPVRTYHGDMGEGGEKGSRWRLKLQLLTRHEHANETAQAQPFLLIITIADPLKTAPIYAKWRRSYVHVSRPRTWQYVNAPEFAGKPREVPERSRKRSAPRILPQCQLRPVIGPGPSSHVSGAVFRTKA